MEEWYPKRILPYLNKDQIEILWNDRELEHNDWFGKTLCSCDMESSSGVIVHRFNESLVARIVLSRVSHAS